MQKNSAKNDAGKFDFIKIAGLLGGLSLLLVIGSLAAIATKGFVYGIDFAGGTEVQVQFKEKVEMDKVRGFADEMKLKNFELQSFAEDNEFLLRFDSSKKGATDKETNDIRNKTIKDLTKGLESSFADAIPVIRRVDSVGPQIGEELKRNGLLAAFYCLLLILVYVGLRFDYEYAPSAVICLFHDAVLTLGIFSLLGKQVNVQTMAAILTIIGYSLNDTIVNFDRIRENKELYRDNDLRWVVNRSINDVLSRTILTSITTLMAVGSLYFIAGGVIEDLAFTLGIGVLIGTYSSVYVASPLLMVFEKVFNAQKA